MAEKTRDRAEMFGLDENARHRGVIEALVIASDDAMTIGRLVDLVGNGLGTSEVRQYIDELNTEYVQTGRSFRIADVAGGYQMTVHPEFAPWIRQLLQEKPARLSQAALETLSIVAFKQPITKAEVEHIRGVVSDSVLRHLLEKGLVRIAGRSDGVGRPLLYGTARDFLRFFGLKTLAELPEIKEVEELLREEEAAQSAEAPVANGGEEDEPEVESQDGETDDDADDHIGVAIEEGNGNSNDTVSGAAEPIPGENGHRVEEDV